MVDNTKFLGVFIDQNLSFHKHIHYIKGKVSRGIGILYKCKPLLNENSLKILYNAIIYPYFTYCIEVWGSTYTTYTDVLSKIQKRAIRIITGAKKYEHTQLLLKKLRILNLKEIYVYFVQLFMYKYHRKLLPQFFDDFFMKNTSVHNVNTRQQNYLHVPLIRTMPFSRTIRVSGVYLYNHFFKLAENNEFIGFNVSYNTYKFHLKNIS